jgi:D-xylose reductase
MLRWATQRGIAVIPKSNNYDRLAANLQCNTFDLSESDIKKISALNISLRVRLFSLAFKFARSTHISSVE